MKRLTAGLVLLTLAIAAAGCGGSKTSTPPPSQPYSANGVSLKYPQSWKAIDATQLGTFDLTKWNYLATFESADSSIATVATVAIRINSSASLAEVASSEAQVWGGEASESTRTVDGVQAKVVTTKANSERQTVLTFFAKDGAVYEVNFSSTNQHFASEKPALDLVLDSLKI